MAGLMRIDPSRGAEDRAITESAADEGVSDAELVGKFHARDRDAFRLISVRYRARALTYVRRYFRAEDRAEDVVQEAFFRVFSKMKRDRNVCPEGKTLEPLVTSIAARTAIDDLRMSSRRAQHEVLALFPVADPSDEEADTIAKEIEIDFRAALATLPPEQQRDVWLYFVAGYTGSEIARMTRSTLSVTRKRLTRAREGLIEHLQPYRKGANHDVRSTPKGGTGEAVDPAVPRVY